MRPIATDVTRSVVCRSVCLLGRAIKTADPIEMPLGELNHVGPRNYILDGVKVHRKEAILGVVRPTEHAMRSFIKILRPVVRPTVRGYASTVYAVVVCPSVRHTPVLYENG